MLQVRARGNWHCANGSHFGAVLWPWPWLVKGTDWTASINASQSVTPQFSSLLAAEALQPEKKEKRNPSMDQRQRTQRELSPALFRLAYL